jgi:hypothetical protein
MKNRKNSIFIMIITNSAPNGNIDFEYCWSSKNKLSSYEIKIITLNGTII